MTAQARKALIQVNRNEIVARSSAQSAFWTPDRAGSRPFVNGPRRKAGKARLSGTPERTPTVQHCPELFVLFTRREPSTADFADTSCPECVCPEIRKAPARLNRTILFNTGPNRGPVQQFVCAADERRHRQLPGRDRDMKKPAEAPGTGRAGRKGSGVAHGRRKRTPAKIVNFLA